MGNAEVAYGVSQLNSSTIALERDLHGAKQLKPEKTLTNRNLKIELASPSAKLGEVIEEELFPDNSYR